MEYWARLGATLDAAGVSAATAMELLGNGESANAFVAVALGRAGVTEEGLVLLKERRRKDAEDMSVGRRTARSLWAIQKGDLEGLTFMPNQTSEIDQAGKGW